MKSIRNLELHVAHGCNLACESCSHYSNQGHTGLLSLDEAAQWMRPWQSRLAPATFSLLGGEPSIHPELSAFLPLVRRHWPAAHIRLVSNGFFLHRHPQLPAAIKRDGNAGIYLSIHHDAPEYRARLEPILALLRDWVRDHGIAVLCTRSYESWTRRYHGYGRQMQPYEDQQPRLSWEHCPAKFGRQLFEGKIWKCAPLAYLKLQQARYGLSERWQPYLQYQPLSPDCSDEQLAAFFHRQEEPHCAMCPAQPARLALALPLRAQTAAIEATAFGT